MVCGAKTIEEFIAEAEAMDPTPFRAFWRPSNGVLANCAPSARPSTSAGVAWRPRRSHSRARMEQP